jgi:penicillin-insensitive murein endopeptidase
MIARIAILLSCLALLIAGAYAVDDKTAISQEPASATAPVEPPAPAPALQTAPEAKPAEPKPADSAAPTVIVPATPPAAAMPKQIEPAPVVVTPPPVATPPVVTAPPQQAPAPVVVAPPALPPEKPAIADTKRDDAKKGKDVVAAKTLFAAEKLPTLGRAMAIGYYPRGCLQGGVALPVNGPTWQVMRLSRNRNWGHPSLVHFLEKFAPAAAKATGWHGILVGDMAQPRGGPTPFGHMSHQTGLDVDVWFMPMPGHVLTAEEREKTSAINLVADDWKRVSPKTWTPQHAAFIRTAAEQPGVERVLVNAAIKKEMCRMQAGKHPDWMEKIRPWYGHHDHIHVRMKCPADSPNCRSQPPVPESDGCGKALDFWFSDKVLHPKPRPPGAKPPKPITLADLPPACKNVLDAPERSAKN